jgi:hypothetical protein
VSLYRLMQNVLMLLSAYNISHYHIPSLLSDCILYIFHIHCVERFGLKYIWHIHSFNAHTLNLFSYILIFGSSYLPLIIITHQLNAFANCICSRIRFFQIDRISSATSFIHLSISCNKNFKGFGFGSDDKLVV